MRHDDLHVVCKVAHQVRPWQGGSYTCFAKGAHSLSPSHVCSQPKLVMHCGSYILAVTPHICHGSWTHGRFCEPCLRCGMLAVYHDTCAVCMGMVIQRFWHVCSCYSVTCVYCHTQLHFIDPAGFLTMSFKLKFQTVVQNLLQHVHRKFDHIPSSVSQSKLFHTLGVPNPASYMHRVLLAYTSCISSHALGQ